MTTTKTLSTSSWGMQLALALFIVLALRKAIGNDFPLRSTSSGRG